MVTNFTKFGGCQVFFNLTRLNKDIFNITSCLSLTRKSIIFSLHSSDLTQFKSISRWSPHIHVSNVFLSVTTWSPVDVIYLDFQKAFEKNSTSKTNTQVKITWYRQQCNQLNIEQWITDRKQRVVVDGEVSNWKSVRVAGVPQGSVLGPILFLVYIDDLEEGVTGSILKFADDTKLFRKTKEIRDEKNSQDDIDKLDKWSENGRCYYIFGNVNVYTHGLETLAWTMKWEELF